MGFRVHCEKVVKVRSIFIEDEIGPVFAAGAYGGGVIMPTAKACVLVSATLGALFISGKWQERIFQFCAAFPTLHVDTAASHPDPIR